MKTIPIDLGDRSYPVHLALGLRNRLTDLLQPLNQGQQWICVTQHGLASLAHAVILEPLIHEGFRISLVFVDEGEEAKSLSQMERLYDRLIRLGCDRSTVLVAFGGGVVGDVTGFAAATFLRGIRYVQIPTTLLGMVDSAIGGKTGINLSHGKNLVGAIYQPQMVCIDPELLASLPPEERVSGLGEVIKYGAICDADFLHWLDTHLSQMLEWDCWDVYQQAIQRSVEIKAAIVSRDERESDQRRILNFGHTVGHALEKVWGYGSIRHGEAVALGMLAAADISVRKDLLPFPQMIELRDVIRQCPLPDLPQIDTREFLAAIRKDKKVRNGQVHMVLLEQLGRTVIRSDVTEDELLASLERI
ncbi:MAG: 3-dehydroquinate synthase [Candidatus Neomarinimicrobiota bacterium]|nr:MAG: 3-dehydroquinate synthase [Candidatus Neomarinimicrobiota bacterium]